MSNYNIYLTKASNGYFVAFSTDYFIAIEEKTEEKALKYAFEYLKEFIIEDVVKGKKLKKVSNTYVNIEKVIEEYQVEGPVFVHTYSLPEIINTDEANKTTRINVALPNWLKALADQAGISPSKFLQSKLKQELGINL